MPVKIAVKKFENHDYVLTEIEAVQIAHDFIVALVVSAFALVDSIECFQELNLVVCIVNIEFSVLSNFDCNLPLLGVCAVGAADHLPECTLINDSLD